jgi:polyhydroxyalkanoate synthesis regulator phasin
MKNFKTKKRTTADSCDAMRCKEAPKRVSASTGLKLCRRHFDMLVEDEFEAFAPSGQAPYDDLEETDPASEALAVTEPAEKGARDMLDVMADFEIVDEESNEIVGEMLRQVHDQLKDLEAKRTAITKPMVAAKKAVDDLFRPAKTALTDAKTLLKGKAQDWFKKKQETRAAAVESGDVSQALAAPEAAAPKTMAERKVWKFRVVDIQKVPAVYLVVDANEVRAAMDAHGPENVNIPGIEVYQETELVMGRAKG